MNFSNTFDTTFECFDKISGLNHYDGAWRSVALYRVVHPKLPELLFLALMSFDYAEKGLMWFTRCNGSLGRPIITFIQELGIVVRNKHSLFIESVAGSQDSKGQSLRLALL